jgi:aryl-alcohol dehydrogenase-like predicted oxidoreductase
VSATVPGARIALGTAQFGLRYGISDAGAPGNVEAARILELAREAGVDTLDTAIAYGDSEARLGELGVEAFAVMSKLSALPEDCADVRAWVGAQVQASLRRLRVPRLAALSLHRPAQALGPRGTELLSALREQREAGRVGAIGVSVYDPEELAPLFAAFDFELVQAPGNVFDRRMAASGWSDRLRQRGCPLHLRSCFLQGLLLLPPARRPGWSLRWRGLFDRWDGLLRESGFGALETSLRFALGLQAERLVLGVDNAAQLEAILALPGTPLELPADLACNDPDLIDPSRWPIPEK